MLRILTSMAVTFFTFAVSAQDAVDTDGDKYKIILENECVRVLDYKDEPGARTSEHRHPPFVLYALSPFKRTITLPTGKVLVREFEVGDVMWSDAQTHVGENIGETPTHVLLVELKGTGAESSRCHEK
jgi:quercetin dioxygenase-like cupin family protein